jgi:hypothetical protein
VIAWNMLRGFGDKSYGTCDIAWYEMALDVMTIVVEIRGIEVSSTGNEQVGSSIR